MTIFFLEYWPCSNPLPIYSASYGQASTHSPQNMHRFMAMSKTSNLYLSPSAGAVSLGVVTISIIPSGQYLAQEAQPVHRSSYQTNSSPRNRGCCLTRSSGYWTVNGLLVRFFIVTIRPLTKFIPYISVGLHGGEGGSRNWPCRAYFLFDQCAEDQ